MHSIREVLNDLIEICKGQQVSIELLTESSKNNSESLSVAEELFKEFDERIKKLEDKSGN